MRKNLLFLVLAIHSLGILNAQEIQLFDPQTNTVMNDDTLTFFRVRDTTGFESDYEKKEFVKVFNNTQSPMSIDLIRTEVQIIPGTGDYYCWGSQCLLERQAGTSPFWQANDPVATAAQDTAGGSAPLSIYLSMNDKSNIGTAIYKYTFQDINTNKEGSVFVRWVISYPVVSQGPEISLVDPNSGSTINDDTLTYTFARDTTGFEDDFEVKKFVAVYNTTDDTMDIDLVRTEIQIIPGTGDYYCWGTQCLLERMAGNTPVWQANDPVITAGKDTAGGLAPLAIYFSPNDNSNVGTAIFKYTFIDLRTRKSSDVFVKWVIDYQTSIKENELKNKFSIYPNPAENRTRVNFENPLNYSNQQIEIFNILGEKIETKTLTSGTRTVELNTENFDSGIYFINIMANGVRVGSKKMIVK